MKKIILILACYAVFCFTSCQKENQASFTSKNNESGIEIQPNKRISSDCDFKLENLTEEDVTQLKIVFENDDFYDFLNIIDAQKTQVGENSKLYNIIIPYKENIEGSRVKALTVALVISIENGVAVHKVLRESATIVSFDKNDNEYKGSIIHVETNAMIIFEGNENTIIPTFPYSPMRPTWWGCMQASYTDYTSDLVGVISMGLYPEVILGMMSVNCWRISAGY